MTGTRAEEKTAKRMRNKFGEKDQSEFTNKRSPLTITDIRGSNYKSTAIKWVSSGLNKTSVR